MERADFLELTGLYADGAATAEQVRALEAALHADPALRQEFLRYLRLDTALGAASAGLQTLPAASPRSRPLVRWMAVASAAAAVLLAWWWQAMPRPARANEPIATLVAATDAVWTDTNVELTLRGGETPSGPARLESGSAEFLFADGATAVLRGPATIRFMDRKRMFLEEGSIFLRCPSPESRQTVATRETEVVDLGTEFAVEARNDLSTRVAVLSGEVKVMAHEPRLLRKGEAVEVRSDGILSIRPLSREDFGQLLVASPVADQAARAGRNHLADPGFETRATTRSWAGTEPNLLLPAPGGRSGNAARISAKGHRFWPQCRQQLQTGDISGRLVFGSVWAASAPDDPLQGAQCAMLKIVFVNAQGHEFAYAMQRFLRAGSTSAGRYVQAQVAAFAPEGTRGVQFQAMLNAQSLASGTVLFDDAALVIADERAPDPAP
jgi:ferric-dicitrate binding protein FerR (iron transport regulator)